MHDIINDLCYIISVVALLGILFFIILEDFDYFSEGTPTWKLQLAGSAFGAIITAAATIGAIFIKDWWENKISVGVQLDEYAEEDKYGGYEVYMAISARNYSKKRDVVLDPPRLELHYDGKRRIFSPLKQMENKMEGKSSNIYKDVKGSIIRFPYKLEPGEKLLIIMNGSDTFRDFFLDRETGEYNFPEGKGNLIVHFEDQLENSFVSPPFRII